MKSFKKTVLPNGLVVITENHPVSRAVAMGAFVHVGTRDENPADIGISHLLEHLVFKGTKNRSTYQIARSLESLGGDLNAYTTREHTCYHSLVLKDHWVESLDVISDLVMNMRIRPKDFKLEKSVILREIASSEESPEEWIYDEFFKCVYGEHGLGRSILGEIPTLVNMTSRRVSAHYKRYYVGPRIIMAAAGNIDHSDFVAEVQKRFKSISQKSPRIDRRKPRWSVQRKVVPRSLEQTHILIGWPSSSFNDRDRFCAFIINALLGGGMTSRLYQSVREKKGLVYTIYSSLQTMSDCGFISIYAATEPQQVKKLISVIRHELIRLKKQKITRSQLELFKTQIKGSLLLGSDDMENRLNSIAVNEMVFGQYKSPESVIEEVDKIDVKEINDFVRNKLPLDKTAGLLLGSNVERLESWWEKVEFI